MSSITDANGVAFPARRRALLASLCLKLITPVLGAQQLSSPMGPGGPAPGQGPGYHSPQSAFPPLVPRPDVVPWSKLADVSVKFQKPRILTTYSPAVLKLNATRVKVEGYMTPLEAGTRHRHFLLLSVPPTCPFCVPGGAESMIEVRTDEPIDYTQQAIVIEGRFQVLKDDPSGLYYRMSGAKKSK
jgi:uncharacterized protein